MPVDLAFWGPAEKQAEVVNHLRKHGFFIHEGLLQVPSGRQVSGSLQSQQQGMGYALSSTPNRKTFLGSTQVCCIFYVY
jgi:hypothetical protein